jgi:hypothetical protein
MRTLTKDQQETVIKWLLGIAIALIYYVGLEITAIYP